MQNRHPDQDEKLTLPKRVVYIADTQVRMTIYICGDTGVTKVDPGNRHISIQRDILQNLTDHEEKLDEKKPNTRYLIQRGNLARQFRLEAGPDSLNNIYKHHAKIPTNEFKAISSEYLKKLGINPENKSNVFILTFRQDADKKESDYNINNVCAMQIVLEAAGVPTANIVLYGVTYDHIKRHPNSNNLVATPTNISRESILDKIRYPLQAVINYNLDLKRENKKEDDDDYKRDRQAIIGGILTKLQNDILKYEKGKGADLVCISQPYKIKKKYILPSLPKNTANAVYVRIKEVPKIFYVDKKKDICVDVTPRVIDESMQEYLNELKAKKPADLTRLEIQQLNALQEKINARTKQLNQLIHNFDSKLEVSKEPKTLTIEGLKYITEVTEHRHHPNVDKLRARMRAIDDIYTSMTKTKQDAENDNLGNGDYRNTVIILRNLKAVLVDERIRMGQDSCSFAFFRVDPSKLGTAFRDTIDDIDNLIENLEKKMKRNQLKK